MSTLADYTDPYLLLPLLRSRSAAAATAELCSSLEGQGRICDLLPFFHSIISREAASGTVISPGWALPHARLVGIPGLSFAAGRTSEPLVWFSGEPVSMVFLFAVPQCEAAAYLSLIAGLARLSRDHLRLARLGTAPDGRRMFEALREITLPNHPAAPSLFKLP
jgi:mannitol/fructose-specific phosphotransferase system IIA component (Ntr-type)